MANPGPGNSITLRIDGKSATEVQTTVEVGGDLRAKQGINYPDGTLNIVEHAPTGVASMISAIEVIGVP